MNNRIIIAGAGGIGRACGLILARTVGEDLKLELADVDLKQCIKGVNWIRSGLKFDPEIKTTKLPANDLKSWNPDGDLLLDCTPGEFAPEFARTAMRCGMHYANLTENLPSTREIYQIAKDANRGFALQTGLAPGFINQLARITARQYKTRHPECNLHSIKMRVGSLSQFASSPGFYAFVWNPKGVTTEYLNDCEVIQKYRKSIVSPLTERESIVINGISYEADLTSGGAADLPTYYNGKIKELNYKTLRYPGHYDYINKLKSNLGGNLSKDTLLQKMIKDIPFQYQDKVIIYCCVSGKDEKAQKQELTHYTEILPAKYGNIQLTAIQRATAGALAQTALLLLTDRFKGVLTQSQYPLDEFLNGSIIQEHYGNFFENT